MKLEWIALNSVRGLGPVRIKHLIEKYGDPSEVLRRAPRHGGGFDGIPAKCAEGLASPTLLSNAEAQLRKAGKEGVEVLTLSDTCYPELLREIFAPPPVLFVKGSTDVFRKHAVGVVGTRRATPYGRNAAARLAGDLASRSIAVVSGLALGIDTSAHEACLAKGGATIAVFGCGLDRIYPAANRALARRILAGGALVSEFPMGTRPEAHNFPRRNRIISGLSAGVVVVEAGKRSGALITAHFALQQGREVFAVPGSIFSEKSEGSHRLIRNGATPVGSADEIVDAVSSVSHIRTMCPPPAAAARAALDILSAEERLMYEELSSQPRRVDQLTESTGKQSMDVLGTLLNLELKGLVRQIAGQQYVRA